MVSRSRIWKRKEQAGKSICTVLRYGSGQRTTRQWIKLRPNYFRPSDQNAPTVKMLDLTNSRSLKPCFHIFPQPGSLHNIRIWWSQFHWTLFFFFLHDFQRSLFYTIMYKCMLQEYTWASVDNISVRNTSKHSGWGLWLWNVSLHNKYETHIENAPLKKKKKKRQEKKDMDWMAQTLVTFKHHFLKKLHHHKNRK